MNIRACLLLLVAVIASMAPLVMPRNTSAASLTDDEISRIRANCTAIRASLNQLHASDALLRVNRGQIYESVGTKLMSNFNSRLASKNFDVKGLVSVTTSYQSTLATFRSDYIIYERQLTNAIRIDCSKDPQTFYDAVEDARTKRMTLHGDVVKLHQYIDDYRSAVNDFSLNYDRVAGGN